MEIDLSAMSRAELVKLKEKVETALKAAEARALRDARKAAEKVVAEFGFSFEQVAETRGGVKRSKAAPRYRNPDNPEQTWTGRGRKPGWVHEALAKGADISDLEI